MITYDFDDFERVIICRTCGLFLCDHNWTHWGMVPVEEAWRHFDLPSEPRLRDGNFFGSTYTGGLTSVFLAPQNQASELSSQETEISPPAYIDEMTRDLGGECHASVNLLWLSGYFDGIVRVTKQQFAARYTHPTDGKDSTRGQWRLISNRIKLAIAAYGTPENPAYGREWLEVRREHGEPQDKGQFEPRYTTAFLPVPADFVVPDLGTLQRKLDEPNPWTGTCLLETPFDSTLHNMWTLDGEIMHRATGALDLEN